MHARELKKSGGKDARAGSPAAADRPDQQLQPHRGADAADRRQLVAAPSISLRRAIGGAGGWGWIGRWRFLRVFSTC